MKNWSTLKKTMLILGLVLIAVILAAISFLNYYFGGLKTEPINQDVEHLGISNETSNVSSEMGIKNIAIFGLDGRDQSKDSGRSDSLMVLSINSQKNTIKLISILRDSYVAIDGHGHEKINHAYAYGGPELAIKTLNKNFNLDIKDYVTANFSQFAEVVDYMGGVDIEITATEKNEINKGSSTKLSSHGKVHLTGEQALAYTRIRKVDSDSVRANRQRTVLEALFVKSKQAGLTSTLALVKNVLPMVKTSLGYGDILGYATSLFGGDANLTQMYIPDQHENPVGGIYEGAWVWRFDIDAAAKRLHEFIYQ